MNHQKGNDRKGNDRKGNDPENPPVQPALGARLRNDLEQLPPATVARLRQLRQAAVAELDTPAGRQPTSPRTPLFIAGGLAASAASVALVVTLLLPGSGGSPVPGLPDLDAEEMALVQSLDVLEELEFLAWMEEEANRAAAG